jgi:hypothetical protein
LKKAKLWFNTEIKLWRVKDYALTPCCCGRRDGSMIFNPNEREVAPPQSNGVSLVQA